MVVFTLRWPSRARPVMQLAAVEVARTPWSRLVRICQEMPMDSCVHHSKSLQPLPADDRSSCGHNLSVDSQRCDRPDVSANYSRALDRHRRPVGEHREAETNPLEPHPPDAMHFEPYAIPIRNVAQLRKSTFSFQKGHRQRANAGFCREMLRSARSQSLLGTMPIPPNRLLHPDSGHASSFSTTSPATSVKRNSRP